MTDLMSANIADLISAFLAAKKQFKPAIKDSSNPHFKSKFVSLAGVHEAVDAALLDNDLILSQQLDVIDGKNVLVSRLMHVSGQWISSAYQLTPVKSDPQAEGSALTYARRYAAMALLGIAPEDDDGEAAMRHRRRPETEEQQSSIGDWHDYIANATTPDELTNIGQQLAASSLSSAARKPLKDAYSAKMQELAPAS